MSRTVTTSARDFVLSQNDASAGIDLVGPLHTLSEIARIAQVDGEPGAPQSLRHAPGIAQLFGALRNHGEWTPRPASGIIHQHH